ncbi:MAG: alanyl-tRNA editing protein [Clostridia bacterium]|nr:alanyl-tRNA editing protein [Clostridia bacterium]
MQTRKLYYEDCHLRRMTATVLGCEERGGKYRVLLDATVFYPEGGGQAADTGRLGAVNVLDVREEGEVVVHICDGPLTPGETVEGELCWEERFARMQQHTGEHMVSGLIHSRFGWHNTGFHMGAEGITIDFDGVIPPEVLPELEAEVNRRIWEDLEVRRFVPGPEELERTFYRTKRALPWPVRIVQIPGTDSCACCGVHCARTGEVGLVKLFSSVPFRGGSRLLMACGGHALQILNDAYSQNKQVSQAFSAKADATGEAARKVNALLEERKFRIAQLERKLFASVAGGYAGRGDVLHFAEDLAPASVRELADQIAEVCGGTAAVFSGTDEAGYSFCLVTRTGDLRERTKAMTAALNGRGGGKPGFQQGSVKCAKAQIEAFFQ